MSDKITFEEFINQHYGLCLIMERYDLDAKGMESIFQRGLSDYIFSKESEIGEEYYSKQTERGYYGK